MLRFYVRHGCGSHCLVHSLLASWKGVFFFTGRVGIRSAKNNGWYKEIHIFKMKGTSFLPQPPALWVPVFVLKGCKVFCLKCRNQCQLISIHHDYIMGCYCWILFEKLLTCAVTLIYPDYLLLILVIHGDSTTQSCTGLFHKP